MHKTLSRLEYGLVGLAALLTLIFILPGLPGELIARLSDYSFPVVGFLTAAVIAARSQTRRGRERLAGYVVAYGFGSYAIGSAIFSYYQQTAGEPPFPGLNDLFWLQFGPAILIALFIYPVVSAGRLHRVQMLLDGLTGSVAAGTILGVLYGTRALSGSTPFESLISAVNWAYVLVDITLLIALMNLSARHGETTRRFLWLSAAVVAFLAADVGYAMAIINDTYVSGEWYDAGWMIAHAFGILASAHQPLPQPVGHGSRPSLVRLIVPYAAVGILTIMVIRSSLTGRSSLAAALDLGFVLTVILLMARQGLAIKTHASIVEQQRRDLVSSISHELRTPLTAVVGFSELLFRPGTSPERQAEMARLMHDEATRVSRIVEDLIDLARNRLGTTRVETRPLEVAGAVGQAVASCERPVTVDMEPELTVMADPDRLAQIIGNLLDNAQKYGRDRITIKVKAVTGMVRFEVHDNGPGVPKRYETDIWRQFDRGLHRLNGSIQGSGIGLAIVSELVHAQHGRRGYEPSSLLGGACFWFELPAVLPHPESVPARP